MSSENKRQIEGSFNLLIVDRNFADRSLVKKIIEEYLSSKYPGLMLNSREAEYAETGLGSLTESPVDLVVFDANFNVLNPKNIEGINEFLIPARKKGYSGELLCWAEPRYRGTALDNGADRFLSKVNGDYLDLPKIVDEVLKARLIKPK